MGRIKPLVEKALRMDGLSYYAKVTTYTDTTHFKANDLAGFCNDFFKDWYVYVVRDAGGAGAAPQNEIQPITDYTSSDGTFTHTAFTASLAVGDEVLIINALNRAAGKTQVIEVSVTSAANAGNVIVGTVTTQPCLIKSIVLHADTAQTTDLTSAAIYGGAGNVITFISANDAIQANLDAADKQVAWTGAVRLAVAKTIVMSLVGTGATAVDLTVTIVYKAAVSGGYLS